MPMISTMPAMPGRGWRQSAHAGHYNKHGEAKHATMLGDYAAHAVTDGHEYYHQRGADNGGPDAAVNRSRPSEGPTGVLPEL